MLCAVVSVDHGGQVILPITLSIGVKGSQHVYQGSVHALALAIPHRMVWSSAGLGHACELAQMPDSLTFEGSTLVRVKFGWKPVMADEVIEEGLGCGQGGLVTDRVCLGVPCEVVRNYQDIFKTTLGPFQLQVVHTEQLQGM